MPADRTVGVCAYCEQPVVLSGGAAACACSRSAIPAAFFDTARRLAALNNPTGRSVQWPISL